MKNKIKHKLILRKEYLQDLYEIYPNAFDIKETTIKINYDKWFIKFMKKTEEWQKYILNNLWVTYIWYMNLLINSLDYDNKVDFSELLRIWVKEWMMKVARKKFIEHDIIKKQGSFYYLNPMIAIKWETINPNLLNLFN